LGLSAFNEDDLYDALDDLRTRQEKIETKLWCHYLTRCGTHPALFLDDVASSYLDGEKNALGLLADAAGEPLAVRVFVGNTSDPSTVATQIEILTRQFSITEVIFVGDCGMIKKVGKQKLDQSAFRQNTALTDPQIRLLLSKKTLQLELFSEEAGEAETDGVRYILRKNPDGPSAFEQSARRKPEAGLLALQAWAKRHKMAGLITLCLDGRRIVETFHAQAGLESLELAGGWVIVSDVSKEQLSPESGPPQLHGAAESRT